MKRQFLTFIESFNTIDPVLVESIKAGFSACFESINNESLILLVKKHLIMDTMIDDTEFNERYNGDINIAWRDFVDNQSIGECQSIVSNIISNFPQFKKVFGEIEIDNPYYDEYGDEQTLMTHHWVTLNDVIYDFSKGTLVEYIDYDDNELYSVDVSDIWRYNYMK